ncbi:MAG: YceI family protein [Bacteroidota bacterium]
MVSKDIKIKVAESKASFSVKKVGFLNVTGELSKINGTIHFDPDNLSSSTFDISVPTATINTNNEKRDEHLRKEDFFSVEQYPEITFKSTSVRKANGQFTTTGNLTLLGVTKAIEIPFTFKDGVFEGNFSLNRLDYALGKKFPAFFIGKTINVSIHCKTNL